MSRALVVIAGIAMVACGGGGGGGGETVTSIAAVTAAPAAPAAVAASPSAPDTLSPDVALALAMTESSADPATTSQSVDLQASPGAEMNGAGRLSADTGVSAGPAAPLAAETAPTVESMSVSRSVTSASVGATYYVDSKLGSDANNGLAATAGTGGMGPWRSLAKAGAAALQPGDTLRLACGSTWNETLRLAASGTAASPITVTSNPAGCTNPAVIDGAVPLAAAAWTVHSGNIYKTTLAATPLQLHVASGAMTQAHHPNRGFDAAKPDSLYLKVAADADRTTINGRVVSTTLTTGTDLALPAGASLLPGLTARIRTTSWIIDESVVSGVSGSRLTLASPTSYALKSGWGYYLLGALWMLDSAGEWHYDAASRTLYSWMPDSRPPTSTVLATTLASGVDLQSRQYVTVDGLVVRRVGVGVNAQRSAGLLVRGNRIEDTAGIGIDSSGSATFIATANVLARTGRDAIYGVDYSVGAATDMQVLGNTITDSGVLTSGDTALSLPVRSYAAIRAGIRGIVTGNNVLNAGYTGIWAWPSSTIADNVITGACAVLDDCGGIYAAGANHNSTIRGNLVLRSRGAMAGKGPEFMVTQAQGIFLDESASGILVQGNTATDNDYGIKLHVSAKNTVSANKLYGNRLGQLWLQETRSTDNAAGDVFGNVVNGNQIVTTSSTAKAMWLDTLYADSTHFGTFDSNRYYDQIFGTAVEDRTATGSTFYGILQWKAAVSSTGVARNNDPNGWGASQNLFAPSLISGSNIIPNGNLASNISGWTSWSPTTPAGSLLREPCAPGWCARYVPGGSYGIVSSPRFSVVNGTWYRLTVDIAASADGQAVDMVVRRGGGGSNGYESLSDRSLRFKAGLAWTRYSITFKATKTINANDPITGDAGARVDLQNILPGQVLSISNLEMAPMTPAASMNRSDLLLNTGASTLLAACPLALTQPAKCANYLRLSDNQPVVWPYQLAGHSSEIVYTRDLQLVDSDGDGIADSQDACPGTPAGRKANSRGCALGQ